MTWRKPNYSGTLLFLSGAVLYALLEILWRGHTHWTMALAGGVCLCLIARINAGIRAALPLRALLGAAAITAVEFLLGCFCNLLLGWQVWDYSSHRANLLGQICPQYCVIWYLLCLPVMAVLDRIPGLADGIRHSKE